MKLSDLKTEDNMKLLMYGDPGEGKTVFGCSFPGPVKLLDFDGKADSAALFYKGNDELLTNIDVETLSETWVESPIDRLMQMIDKEFIPQQKTGEMQFKTLILDSITTFSSAVLNHIVRTNPGVNRVRSKQGVQPSMQDYGILKREFKKLIPGLLSLPCNVIMMAHIEASKDENTGELIRGPVMDGAFSQQLPIYFKEVWRIHTNKEGKRMAQTQSDMRYKCRSQIKGLPNPLNIEKGYEVLTPFIGGN